MYFIVGLWYNKPTVRLFLEEVRHGGSREGSKKPIRIFEYRPDRSGKRPANFLKGFTGYLVTDGYAGYNQVASVTHCGCWAHARRKWREAMPE